MLSCTTHWAHFSSCRHCATNLQIAESQTSHKAPSRCRATDPAVALATAGDIRTVDKLADGASNTMDDTHMWLAPIKRQLSSAVVAAYQQHQQRGSGSDRLPLPEATRPFNLLTIRLPAGSQVAGLRLWNYNKSAQDTARGVKRMLVLAGGRLDGKHWVADTATMSWQLLLCS